MRATLLLSCLSLAAAMPCAAQDPTKVDPEHYKVVFENEQVRMLRISYGPNEKSVMHEHPAHVGHCQTDAQIRMNTPDGESQDITLKAGEPVWDPGGQHLPENLSDEPFECVVVELKK